MSLARSSGTVTFQAGAMGMSPLDSDDEQSVSSVLEQNLLAQLVNDPPIGKKHFIIYWLPEVEANFTLKQLENLLAEISTLDSACTIYYNPKDQLTAEQKEFVTKHSATFVNRSTIRTQPSWQKINKTLQKRIKAKDSIPVRADFLFICSGELKVPDAVAEIFLISEDMAPLATEFLGTAKDFIDIKDNVRIVEICDTDKASSTNNVVRELLEKLSKEVVLQGLPKHDVVAEFARMLIFHTRSLAKPNENQTANALASTSATAGDAATASVAAATTTTSTAIATTAANSNSSSNEGARALVLSENRSAGGMTPSPSTGSGSSNSSELLTPRSRSDCSSPVNGSGSSLIASTFFTVKPTPTGADLRTIARSASNLAIADAASLHANNTP